uniref:Uncharacterized protein n=1 Tax=Rhizophora mucronata TaxID=61149 RepID=A0A2P2R590_RHIMU
MIGYRNVSSSFICIITLGFFINPDMHGLGCLLP